MNFSSAIIPQSLILSILFFVVLPSILALGLRWKLYFHLNNATVKVRRLINLETPGNQPEIVKLLRRRYEIARKDLEQVNTAALIDQVYSQERIGRWRCDQVDYYCKILPNLLLVFGLLGTFWGITLNLLNLGDSIDSVSTTNITNVLGELKEPLKGMGIAFFSSLSALFFSAILTIINSILNTNAARYNLLSALEDYLDNVFLPSLEHTRMDTAVERMTQSLDRFLDRFGQTVRQAVESALGNEIQKVVDGNLRATELAEQVYSKFLDSSSNWAAGSQIFLEAAETFKSSDFAHTLAKANADLAQTQKALSDSALTLQGSSQTLAKATQELTGLGENLGILNQKSLETLEVTHKNQQSLGEIVPQLQNGANSFKEALKTLKVLNQKVNSKTQEFDLVKNEIARLIDNLNIGNQHLQAVSQNIETFTRFQSENFDRSTKESKNLFVEAVEQLKAETNAISIRLAQLIEKQTTYSSQETKTILNSLDILGKGLKSVIQEVSGFRKAYEDAASLSSEPRLLSSNGHQK